MTLRNHKAKAYPTKEQRSLIEMIICDTRHVYNKMLERNMKAYERRGEHLTRFDMTYLLTEMKEYKPWLHDSDSKALVDACIRLNQAYENFFARRAEKPKFKSKKAGYRGYTTDSESICFRGNRVYLPKVGWVKVRGLCALGDEAVIKRATVKIVPTGKIFITLCVDEPRDIIPDIRIDEGKVIGLDYKSNGFYEDDLGNIAGSPKYYRKAEKKLAHLERLLSKKKGSKKGEHKSNNYLKLRHRINLIHEKIADSRKDFLDKLSTEIANRCDAVCVEDLNMKAMSNKGFGNGKATLDNGWGMFIQMLEYKLQDRGKKLVKVDKFYPSTQTCSECGYTLTGDEKLTLKDRKWTCPKCGAVHDRDHNAAINIRNEGIRILIEEGCLAVEEAA